MLLTEDHRIWCFLFSDNLLAEKSFHPIFKAILKNKNHASILVIKNLNNSIL